MSKSIHCPICRQTMAVESIVMIDYSDVAVECPSCAFKMKTRIPRLEGDNESMREKARRLVSYVLASPQGYEGIHSDNYILTRPPKLYREND